MTSLASEAKSEPSRKRLLELVTSGHDLESAAHLVGMPIATIKADPELMTEVAEAYRVATSKLRARLLSVANEDADTRTLGRLLDHREAMQLALPVESKDLGGDGGFAVRLKELTCDELALVEWLLDGIGPRPPCQLSYAEGMHLAGQRRAAERVRADRLEVSDPLRPLPKNRSIVKSAVVLPPDGIQDLAASDPGAAAWWLLHGPR